VEAAAQGKPWLVILKEHVEIAQLYMITALRRPIPWTLPRVVSRRHGVSVSNLDPVIIEKQPAVDPHTVAAGRDDPVPEGGVLRRSKETTEPCTGFAGNMIQREEIAVIKADIQRADLGVEAEHP
jgi:hypothetical protein